jgi:tripartite-type tricarboxylate transporter receptor subunit TctC
MIRRTLLAVAVAAICGAAVLPLCAHAQSDRTVRILVGFPPGGSLDTVARLLAEKMKDELKANVVVENKPGAGGRLAADLLKNAAADGNTLMMAPVVVPVLAPLVFSKLTYNPATDFAPVGHVASFSFALTVPTALPVKNVAEMVAWMKANPKSANFGSPAAGSLPHFFGELISREAGADMVHVPYAGGAGLMTALVGNQVSAGIDVLLETLEAHKGGRVRVIATSGDKRSPALPDVPTFKESGYPGVVAQGWMALYAPAKTPDAAISAANRALNKALASADMQERFAKLALEAGGGSPADLTRLEQSSTARWAPVVKATGFKAD